MAITILSTPSSFMAAYNQIPYTVSSNMTSQPNFNFIVDVNEIGGTNNPLARLKYPKQPSSSELTFDVGNVLKNYVSYDFNNVTGVIAVNNKSRLKYYTEYRELYDVSGVPTLSGVLARNPTTPSTSSFKLATNCIFDFEQYSQSAMATKSISSYGFLNGNQNETITSTQEYFLSWFDPSRVAAKIRYIASNGNYVDEGISLPANEYIFTTRAGVYAQDVIIGAGFELTNAYKIEILDENDVVLASKTFLLNQECSQYETVRLHWLNKLGGFEAFNFNKNTINAMSIDRKQFKAPLPIGYSKSDRLKTNYNTTINDKITINSDWISEEQSALFEQLATSPIIYLERSANDFVAVNILNAEYEIKTFLTDRKLFNVTFEIEYSYSRYRQSL